MKCIVILLLLFTTNIYAQTVEQYRPYICRIASVEQTSNRTYTSFTSGCLFYKHDIAGYIITCAHAFREAKPQYVIFNNDNNQYKVHDYKFSLDEDLAIMTIVGYPSGLDNPPMIYTDEYNTRIKVTAAGFGPGSGKYSEFIGDLVAKSQDAKGFESYVINNAWRSGDSGGPIFHNGYIVGVAWGSIERDKEGYYVPGSRIKRFLTGRVPKEAVICPHRFGILGEIK